MSRSRKSRQAIWRKRLDVLRSSERKKDARIRRQMARIEPLPVATRLYVIYDDRAIDLGTDHAAVLDSCTSIREAKSARHRFGCGMACYSYEIRDGSKTMTDERFEWSWQPEDQQGARH